MKTISASIVACMAALALVATLVESARAEYSVGGSFTSPGYGASAWGMGGAAIASIADEGAVYWNPAMLSVISGRRLGFSYTNIVPGTDTRLSYVAYAQSIKHGPTDEVGMEFAVHAVGAIYGNLGVELADGQSYNENTLRIAYAYCPEHFVSFGISFTGLFASSGVPDFGANGSTIDASLRIALMKGLTAAAVGRNLLSQGDFEDGTSLALPRSYALGVSYEAISGLLAETDIEYQFGSLSRWVIGGQYTVYRDMVAARAGMASVMVGDNRAVAYLGLGVHARGFYVDYAASFDHEEALGNAHRFSLGLGF